MILLTGATGNTGGQVAAELTRRNIPFRVMVRSQKSEEALLALGYQTVRGDMDDPRSLREALSQGFEKAYLVSTPDEKMILRECNFIDAAREAGVKHIVKMSAFLAGPEGPTINLRSHGHIERWLMASGIPWTIVRPHGFMQTFVLFSLDLVKGAGLYLHSAGDGAMPLVDVRDVAMVATKALTEDGHTGKAYDITGPEALTFRAQAEILARAFHRPVTYVEGKERDLSMAMEMMGVAPQSREHVVVIMRMCREHQLNKTTNTLQQLGITPITFSAFADDLVSGRTGGGSSFSAPDSLLFKAMSRAMIFGYRAKFALFGREVRSPH